MQQIVQYVNSYGTRGTEFKNRITINTNLEGNVYIFITWNYKTILD